jgi:hypothetical protein
MRRLRMRVQAVSADSLGEMLSTGSFMTSRNRIMTTSLPGVSLERS